MAASTALPPDFKNAAPISLDIALGLVTMPQGLIVDGLFMLSFSFPWVLFIVISPLSLQHQAISRPYQIRVGAQKHTKKGQKPLSLLIHALS